MDGLNQATLMGNNIKHLSEEQSNSMMTASNFVFRGIKAKDSAVNGHGITVNLNSSAKRAVLNRSVLPVPILISILLEISMRCWFPVLRLA